MLITSRTPRMTYRIGMRRTLVSTEDKPLPWLGREAPTIEVAADFTGVYEILMWKEVREVKTANFTVTKVPRELHDWRGVGKEAVKPAAFNFEAFRFFHSCSSAHESLRRDLFLYARLPPFAL